MPPADLATDAWEREIAPRHQRVMVPPDEAQALADAIGKFAADLPLLTRFGAASRRLVESEFHQLGRSPNCRPYKRILEHSWAAIAVATRRRLKRGTKRQAEWTKLA